MVAGGIDDLITGLEVVLQEANANKHDAEEAYTEAAKYTETEAQKASEEKARAAYHAAKEHHEMIKGYLIDAVKMQ
jgi:hypothetical protein